MPEPTIRSAQAPADPEISRTTDSATAAAEMDLRLGRHTLRPHARWPRALAAKPACCVRPPPAEPQQPEWPRQQARTHRTIRSSAPSTVLLTTPRAHSHGTSRPPRRGIPVVSTARTTTWTRTPLRRRDAMPANDTRPNPAVGAGRSYPAGELRVTPRPQQLSAQVVPRPQLQPADHRPEVHRTARTPPMTRSRPVTDRNGPADIPPASANHSPASSAGLR